MMMWEIPISIMIIVWGVIYVQARYIEFCLKKKKLLELKESSQELEELRDEFQRYKKKVDSLIVRAGFKL